MHSLFGKTFVLFFTEIISRKRMLAVVGTIRQKKTTSTIYNMSGRVVLADTNSSQRREFVCPIQHGRKCCKWLKKLIIL